jgi:hypothetical protein
MLRTLFGRFDDTTSDVYSAWSTVQQDHELPRTPIQDIGMSGLA